jgi:hypothetical protein
MSVCAGCWNLCREGDAGWMKEVEAITKIGLSDFDTYIEILVTLRGDFHRNYVIKSFDATMLKNKPGALLAQPEPANLQGDSLWRVACWRYCCRLLCCDPVAT